MIWVSRDRECSWTSASKFNGAATVPRQFESLFVRAALVQCPRGGASEAHFSSAIPALSRPAQRGGDREATLLCGRTGEAKWH